MKKLKKSQIKRKGQGVLLFACGKGTYGQYAYNLALSIKTQDPECKIALICDDSCLVDLQDNMYNKFDILIEPEESDLYVDGKMMPSRFKTLLYDYSPFERTIFLDVDSLWFPGKKVSWLFYELQDLDFTAYISTVFDAEKDGGKKLMDWGYLGSFCKVLGIEKGRVDQMHSHFIYFTECDKVEKFFENARWSYDQLMENHDEEEMTLWAGQVADEICFAMATNLTGLYCHKEIWNPTVDYWRTLGHGNPEIYMHYFFKYWGMTVPGYSPGNTFVEFYNYIIERANKYSKAPIFKWNGDKFNSLESDSEACSKEEPIKKIESTRF